MNKIGAVCTWGEGSSDITIVNKGAPYLLFDELDITRTRHGISRDGQMDLTVDEAKILAKQLLDAVNRCGVLNKNLAR